MSLKVAVVGAAGGMGALICDKLEKAGDEVARIDAKYPTIVDGKWPASALVKCLQTYEPDVIIDFSTAEAVAVNLPCYIENEVPFVIGTTSWDYASAENDRVHGVVDQNMHPVLVALLDSFEYMAQKYKGVLNGYGLHTTEEHQESKPKPSGTAPVWMKVFAKMGAETSPLIMRRLGEDPHAFHFYDFIKGFLGKAATAISITTKIWGRDEYADGAILAARYLCGIEKLRPPRIHNMRDVLSAAT